MGDIGGAAQAGASIADTGMNDATQLAVAGMNDATQLSITGIQDKFNDTQATKARNFAAQQAQIANTFSAQQAQKNRDFQMQSQLQAQRYDTQMSNTAMQRRVADLKSAGLNPLLSMGPLGGASSPVTGALGGSSAQGVAMGGPAASSSGVPHLGATSDALQSINQRAMQNKLVTAQANNLDADSVIKRAQGPYAAQQAAANLDQTQADVGRLVSQAFSNLSQFDFNEQNVANLQQDKNFRAQIQPLLMEAQRLSNQAATYGLSKARVESQIMNSPLGAYLTVTGLGHAAGGDVGAAAALAAWQLYQNPIMPSRRRSQDVQINDPTGLTGMDLESSGIGAPTP